MVPPATLDLYLLEDGSYRHLVVPTLVVRHLLQDRLGESDAKRIARLAKPILSPGSFKKGSVVVDMAKRTAELFGVGIKVSDLETTWTVLTPEMTLGNY